MTQNIKGTLKKAYPTSYEGVTQLVQFDEPVPGQAPLARYSEAFVPAELNGQHNFSGGKRVMIETEIKGPERACFVKSMSPL